MRRLFIMTLVLLAAAGVPAQRKCWKCKGEGFLACTDKAHDARRNCGRWEFEHRCDAVYEAECCRGTLKVHCKRCNDPVAEVRILQELEDRKAWVESQERWLEPAGVRAATVATEAFILHFMPRRWLAREGRYRRTHAAHLFAWRLHELTERWKEVVGVLPHRKQRFYITSSGEQNMQVTLHKMGGGHRNPFRQWGQTGQVCTWPDRSRPRLLDDDENMHAHVVHLATHLLHRAAIKSHRDRYPMWLDAGLAHWMSLDLTEKARDFCFNESTARDVWRGADWENKIYNEVAGRDALAFATLAAKHSLDQTVHRDHAYAWSFVDHLIRDRGDGFQDFYRSIKQNNDTQKALDETFGLSTASFQDGWRQWVLRTYAPR